MGWISGGYFSRIQKTLSPVLVPYLLALSQMVSSARNKSCSIAFELGIRVQGHPQLGVMFILLAEHKLTLLGMRGPNGCTWRFYVRKQ